MTWRPQQSAAQLSHGNTYVFECSALSDQQRLLKTLHSNPVKVDLHQSTDRRIEKTTFSSSPAFIFSESISSITFALWSSNQSTKACFSRQTCFTVFKVASFISTLVDGKVTAV